MMELCWGEARFGELAGIIRGEKTEEMGKIMDECQFFRPFSCCLEV